MSIIALQLYTIRDFTEADLLNTLHHVKQIGYDYVELAGMYGYSAIELKKLLDTAELKAISAHVPIEAFEEDARQTVADYKLLGCQYIAIPSLSRDVLPGGDHYTQMRDTLINIGMMCNDKHIRFAYHNHAYEFEKLDSGTTILDALFEDLPTEVIGAEIDTGWVTAANVDPAAYIRKYSGRCALIHLKDTVKVGASFEDRPVGSGTQDIEGIIKTALDINTNLFVVELDEAHGMTSLEAAAASRTYLKNIGL